MRFLYIFLIFLTILSTTHSAEISEAQGRALFDHLAGPLEIPATPLKEGTTRYFCTVPGERAKRVHWYTDLVDMGFQYTELNAPASARADTVFMDLSGLKNMPYYRAIKPTQRVSSFPSVCRALTHKGLLPAAIRSYYAARDLSFPERDHFMAADTFYLDDVKDRTLLFQRPIARPAEWLVKPTLPSSRRGKGIFSYAESCGHALSAQPNLKPCPLDFQLTDQHLIQKFAADAKSINDHFTTARWVFLIASVQPLRIYALPLTIITSATPMRQQEDGSPDLSDPESFITNTDYASNLLETRYSFLWFLQDFIQNATLAEYISEETEKLIMATLFPVLDELRKMATLLPNASFTGHQLIGMDFVFDQNWRPKLLEHNCRPDVSLFDLDVCLDVFHQIRQFTFQASGILPPDRNFTTELASVTDHVDQAIRASGIQDLDPDLRSHLILATYENQQLPQFPRWRKIFPPIHRPHLLSYYQSLYDFSPMDEFFFKEIHQQDDQQVEDLIHQDII